MTTIVSNTKRESIEEIDLEKVEDQEFYIKITYWNGIVSNYAQIDSNLARMEENNYFDEKHNVQIKIYKIKVPIKI